MKQILFIATLATSLMLLSFKEAPKHFHSITLSDSTKPQVKKEVQQQPPQFFIIGQEPDFKLLEKVIADPRNVTPNERDAVLQWIQKRNQLVTDTSQKKKN